LLVLIAHGDPAGVGVEALELLKLLQRVLAEIPFVDDAVVTHHEGLDAAHAVFGRRRDERKAANHHAFDYEVELAEWRGRALPFQDLEEVAVIGLGAARVTLRDRAGDLFAYWATPGSIRVLPCQSVPLARCTDDALGILVDVIALTRLQGILVLRLHVATADPNCVQFVLANATTQQ